MTRYGVGPELQVAIWLVLGGILHAALGQTVPVIERDGRGYVAAKALGAVWQIGIKPLPGRPEFAVCHQDRCALVNTVLTDTNGDRFVEVEGLAKALSAETVFAAAGHAVSLRFPRATPASRAAGLPHLGGFAPNIRLTTLSGKPISLADFRGRRVLINSWASWCGCRNDLPAWQKFYQRHAGDNFEILSVAADVQGPQVVRPYVEKAGVTFTVAVDETDVLGRAFGLKYTPVSILVDELGIIRAEGGGPSADFLARTETVLREPLSPVRTGTQPVARTEAELESCIAASPRDWRSRVELAAMLASEREFAGALQQLQAAAQLAPAQADVHFLAGEILMQQGKRDAALAKFRQALLLDEQNWRVRKQIWAIEHPDKFYSKDNPDYGWQSRQLSQERTPRTPPGP